MVSVHSGLTNLSAYKLNQIYAATTLGVRLFGGVPLWITGSVNCIKQKATIVYLPRQKPY